MTDLINKEGLKLPLVALRDMVVFPRVSTSLDVGRKESVAAVRSAAGNDRYLIMLMQKTPEVEMPLPEDLYTIGTVAKIEQMLQLPGGIIRILVKGVSRVRVSDIERNTGHLTGTAVDIEETHEIRWKKKRIAEISCIGSSIFFMRPNRDCRIRQ